MKIVFTGTHGVGKTTLAKKISKLINIPYIEETALEMKSEYSTLSLYPNTNEQTQLMIFLRQLFKENKHHVGIFDRCLFDCIAYSVASNLFGEDIIKEMIDIATQKTKEFDYIFLVTRFADNVPYAWYRDLDCNGAMFIESIIVSLLQSFKYYVIYEKSFDERVEKIMDVIGDDCKWQV